MKDDVMVSRTCTCRSWKLYAPQIFHAQSIAFVQGLSTIPSFNWLYCPWCGSILQKESDVEVQ